MLRISEKIILILIIIVALCGTVTAFQVEDGSEIVISTRIGMADGEFGYKTYEDGSWNEPNAIAFDSSGNIYISDPLYSRIQKFDKTGKYLSKINIKIEDQNKVTRIIDLAIDKTGNVYALNKFDKIFVFGPNGNLINTISLEGKKLAWSQSNGWYDEAPVQCEKITFDEIGHIYIQTFDALIKLDRKGNVLKKWSPNVNSNTSQFFLDPDGNLYFSPQHNVWEMYDKNGNYLKLINSANNPYIASCPQPANDCHFPPNFVDSKGNYLYFSLDSKTNDLKTIYKFNKEHKLINEQTISSLDYNAARNMVKFDSVGNLFGPSKFGPTKKRKFPLILKIATEK